ncbi:MAG TPA: polyprenyl synthetase family protein [Mesotoga infera]|jgi:geranylgeranyl diphosphate synthase type II|uniref:Geranylgeranyl pyrophosphate synthase n=1 Tax=Mesotoga infera TaxID=1236046 RepID=A0A101I6X0_9BACT|nr:MAG: Geranylgeranyl pyrophosphate synthase [Mesotoga infera]HCO69516.1 polyprenyl synthetase family protein [Mesotoga infera]
MNLAEFTPFFNMNLRRFLDELDLYEPLKEVVSYTPLAGGKRLRAYLVWELSRFTGFGEENALKTGIAVELFHSGSLIHDDLPAIDNDTMRRGLPSSHVKFGECKAILAGDFLMLYPSKLLSSLDIESSSKLTLLKLWQETSLEVVKGEFEDVFPENKSREQMERIHGSKTGSLFGFCFAAPFAGRKEEKFVQMRQLGLRFGKLFQMMDDIKDVTSTETELGKTPGKDGKQDKLTILSFESLEEAQMKVKEMFLGLLEEIDEFSDLSREMVNVYDLIAKR